MKYFKLPDLGEGLPEVEIIKWHVNVGDEVKTDQLLVSVETAKAIVDVPSPQTGIIAALFGGEGDIVHVGEPLVEYAGEENKDTGTVVGKIETHNPAQTSVDHFIIGSPQKSTTPGHSKATPAVRALAIRLKVNIETINGTGKGGLITSDDVQLAAQLGSSKGESESLRGVRRAMANNMARARDEIVPVTLFDDADINAWPVGTDITIRLIFAISDACTKEPALNCWFDGNTLSRRLLSTIDLGMAVDTPDGLFVPVLRDIANRTSDDLRSGLNNLRADVKNRSIPPQELQGATFTLSNFGTIGGSYANPIVMPPTVAILGAGSVRKQVVVVNDEIVIHKIMPLSFTFDHRAATGGEAARFLQAVINHLNKVNPND